MTTSKINCWQYMQCGRELDGSNVWHQGVCPAACDASFDGIHGGKNAGRFCWAVTGTFCGRKIQGTFARKRASCINCPFYQRVQAEEGTANLRTKFLRFLTPNGSTLKGLSCRQIPEGTRFLVQGEMSPAAYLIQRGACIKLVEKDGELHPFDHYSEGDIVGMTSLLTGEVQTAHVEAETDMDVRIIDKTRFDLILRSNPELCAFLTEIVADRLDSHRPIACRTIGAYVATEIIGRGGYSVVYKGFRTETKQPVAIKMLRHHLALQDEFLSNFHKEARIIAGLRHLNIISVFDIIEHYRTVFIIMEHLEGESLKELLMRQVSISPVLVVSYLRQAYRAVAHAHRSGLVHRDLNPANMMILPDGSLKLIDFGLACPAGTEDCEFGGALPYQAPELLSGHSADQRSDIYALGVSAFEMLTGERPHESKSIGEFLQRRKMESIPDPATRVPELPDELRRFIKKACDRYPAQRYADAGEALNALGEQNG